jgi:hypothetical protein
VIVQIVRFKSGLSDEQVLETYQVKGAPDVAMADVVMALRPDVKPATGS